MKFFQLLSETSCIYLPYQTMGECSRAGYNDFLLCRILSEVTHVQVTRDVSHSQKLLRKGGHSLQLQD